MPLLLITLASALYQPLPWQELRLQVLADDSVWVVGVADVSLPAAGRTVAWDTSGLGADAAAARIALPSSPQVTIEWRAVVGQTVRWRLRPSEGVPATATVRCMAPVRDVKVRWRHEVAVAGSALMWQAAVQLSGWKGEAIDTLVAACGGRASVRVYPDRTVSLPLWRFEGIGYRPVVRWDSRNAAAGCRRVLVVERAADTEFGRRRLPAGEVVVVSGDSQAASEFPGAGPGETIELAAGPAEGVSVSRTLAQSTQVNVREDVHRRLAAYDEQLRYEYAVRNASTSAVTVEIVEHPGRGWRVRDCSHRWRRKDADTLIITVPLKPASYAVVTATVVRANQLPQ